MRATLLAEVIGIVRDAGVQIMKVYERPTIASKSKADKSPVTDADMAAHETIAKGLARLMPGVPVISEEDLPEDAADLVRSADACWLVDPLDGTRDFLARSGEFTVNVALLEKGKPVAGVVQAPATGRLFFASRSEGAFRVEGDAKVRLKTRTMKKDEFEALVSNMHGRGEAQQILLAYPKAVIRPVGSSLKYVTIAEGLADLSIRYSPTSLWDTAAAQCILEEAGGAIIDFSGKSLSYKRGDLVNPPFVAIGDRAADVASLVRNLRPT